MFCLPGLPKTISHLCQRLELWTRCRTHARAWNATQTREKHEPFIQLLYKYNIAFKLVSVWQIVLKSVLYVPHSFSEANKTSVWVLMWIILKMLPGTNSRLKLQKSGTMSSLDRIKCCVWLNFKKYLFNI